MLSFSFNGKEKKDDWLGMEIVVNLNTGSMMTELDDFCRRRVSAFSAAPGEIRVL